VSPIIVIMAILHLVLVSPFRLLHRVNVTRQRCLCAIAPLVQGDLFSDVILSINVDTRQLYENDSEAKVISHCNAINPPEYIKENFLTLDYSNYAIR